MTGVVSSPSLTPSESQQRATSSCKAAAPAVRPPTQTSPSRRGRRSQAARLRRRIAWNDRVRRYGDAINSSGSSEAGETTEPVHDMDGLPQPVLKRDPLHTVHGNAAVTPPKGDVDAALFHPSASSGAREPCLKELDASSLSFLLANVQGFVSKSAELAHLVERCDFPSIVGFTETFLDPSKTPSLDGYVEVARLDRRSGERQGGILLYARRGFENSVVHVGNSKIHERSWFLVHTDRGAICLALWYRRPDKGETQSIDDLYDELEEFTGDAIYTVIMGDMNVHEQTWLKYSDGSTEEGRELLAFSNITGLEERVGKPTRGENLLDLVLSDLAGDLKCTVCPGVSDHDAVLGRISFGVPTESVVERELFDYERAPWQNIMEDFESRGWDAEFDGLSVDAVAERLTAIIMETLRRHVRCKKAKVRISSHPWLNDRCRAAIDARIAAKGTCDERIRRDECSRILSEEHSKYVERMKVKLRKAAPSAKKWWKMSNSLQGRGKNTHGIQSLRRADGSWARTATEKVELLSETFLDKAQLPSEVANEFSPLPPGRIAQDTFLPVRTRDVARQLRKLKEDSATGPDAVASRVLTKCASCLARPVALVIRRMLQDGRWPQCWRFHSIVPLYKKKAKSDPLNYRGVHLTSQISKVVERVIGKLFLPKLQADGVYGDKQFAYSTGRGHQDALALSVLSWLLSLERGNMVALYCSDVSGAFDRVWDERLSAKLQCSGLHPRVLDLLKSWLEPRTSSVVLEGCSSKPQPLTNSVYQGTVFGPPLWNVHYADAKAAVQAEGFVEVVFADDLNCSKDLGPTTTETQARQHLRRCQTSLHRWGSANKVVFDPGKESFHAIHRTRYFGEEFKILGVLFDTQLTMRSAAHEVAREAGWKTRSLLRCRKFYSQPEMVKLYKSQVLSFIESRTAALHHAAPSVLDVVDRVQRRFLREIGLTEVEAMLKYRLAPLPARRDIAMLGLLHRASHGRAPAPLADLLLSGIVHSRDADAAVTRAGARRHARQIPEYLARGGHTETLRRSAFGLATVWNMLPVRAAGAKTTKACQKSLQQSLISRALQAPDSDWPHFFQKDARVLPVHVFQRLFV